MTNNVLDFMKGETIQHFRQDPMTGKLHVYELDMSRRMKKQLGNIAESIQQLKTYEKYQNAVVGSTEAQSKNH